MIKIRMWEDEDVSEIMTFFCSTSVTFRGDTGEGESLFYSQSIWVKAGEEAPFITTTTCEDSAVPDYVLSQKSFLLY